MTDRYVYSGATGTGTGADWANAYTTLTAAFSGGSAGDRFFVAHDHSESTAGAVTLTPPVSLPTLSQVLCVNRSGSVPPVSADLRTTAIVATSGNNAISVNGGAYWYGIDFRAGVGASGTASINLGLNGAVGTFKNCTFRLSTTGASSVVNAGQNTVSGPVLKGCSLYFGSTSQKILLVGGGPVFQESLALASGSSVPDTLFTANVNPAGIATVRGVDLSAFANKTLVGGLSNANGPLGIRFRNCRLGTGMTIASGSIASPLALGVDLDNCDSADTNYRMERYRYAGDVRQETTIVRSGGASDGVTPISWKMTANSNARQLTPLETPPIFFRYDGPLGIAKTASLEVLTDGVTLKDTEAWAELEYLGTSGFPKSSVADDGAADILATAADQAASTATWTTTGLTSPVKQKLGVTFTPQEVGIYQVVAKLAKASQVAYLCPRVVVA